MKNKKPIVFLLIGIIIIISSCVADRMDRHRNIPIQNNTNHSVYVLEESKEQYFMFPSFQDTILQPWYCDPSTDSTTSLIKPREEKALFSRSGYEYEFGYEYDTLLVFVINADTLKTYGWDTVRVNYKVEQRYDLSLADLQSVDFRLTIPPTKAMKHIHMWPPYGTYGQKGSNKKLKP